MNAKSPRFPRSLPSLLGLCAALWLGCGSGDTKPASPTADAGLDGGLGMDGGPGDQDAGADAGVMKPPPIFGVLRELRERVRQSPDHLTARASELVAKKDAEGLFELVRDQVSIYPRALRGRRAALGATRSWGPRGALRSGLATPRDKAELLRELLVEAGFEAEVVVGTLIDARQDALARYHEPPKQGFAVNVSDADLARWAEQLGGTLPASRARVVDADGSNAQALAASLGALVAPPAEPLETDLVFEGSMPLVRFVRDGQTVYANPLFRDAVLGESYTRNNPVRLAAADLEPVTLRLWARRNHSDVSEDVVLAETRVDTNVAAGRRFVVRTVPLLPLRGLLEARPDDVRAFLPAIELEGHDVDEAEKAMYSVAGTPFNLEADRLDVSDDGKVRVEGVALASRDDSAAARATAVRMEVSANPARFDDVTLALDVLDASDQPVEALGPADFRVEEEGVVVGASLRRNESRLRVLFVYDASTSIPEAFRGEGLVAFARDIATQVFENPRAELSVSAVSSSEPEPFTRDVDEVERQARLTSTGSSSIWQALATAEARNADLILFLSDMKATDVRTEARRAAIVRGSVPILVLGVGDVDTAVANDAVALAGGEVVSVSDVATAKQEVARFTARRKASYELSYRAPIEGPSTRDVRVSLSGTTLRVDTQYEVPAAAERGGPRGFTGLYLTVSIGTRNVTRTLAGAPKDAEPSIEDVQAVRDALFGVATLVFEPGPLPFSVALDEWISERLEWERFFGARGSYERFVEELEKGIPRTLPARLLLAGMPSYDRSTSLTYDTHLRTLLLVEQPRFGEGRVERVDLLPFAELATSGRDAAEAWDLTFTRSLHWAALESQLGTSTEALLKDDTLVSVAAEDVGGLFAADEALAQRFSHAARGLDSDYTLLVPEDGEPVAFWSVYEPTGSVLGVLSDGSGGASNAITDRVERNLAFYDMIESMAQTGAVTGGAWLDLELAKARLVSYATLWIATVGDGFPDVPDGISPEDMAQDYVEGQIQDHLLELLPGNVGEHLDLIEGWMGLVSAATDEP